MISCVIGQYNVEKALCDLSASINLLPYTIYKHLDLGEIKLTLIILKLVDRSVRHSMGVIGDVLV